MSTDNYIKAGRITALISFLLGTLIFGLYYLTSEGGVLFMGYGYILVAGIINLAALFVILAKAINDNENRKRLLMTSGLILVNIPVMVLYCWFAIVLLNTMRITFMNKTGTKLTDINIVGCGGAYISELEKGESETVWVKIKGDCGIHVDYLLDEQRKKRDVTGYVTKGMGGKMTYIFVKQ